MTGPAAQEPPSAPEAPPARGRASAIGAVAFALLTVPFLIFSGMMLTLKARVELQCNPPGECTLIHLSLLDREEVEKLTVEELQGATVERNRTTRKGGETLYKPVLETTRGKFPLSSRWLENEAEAERTVQVVNRFRSNPFLSQRGFTLFHDHRRGPLIVGISFGAVGVLLLGVSVWLAFKARRHSRAERAARTTPPAA